MAVKKRGLGRGLDALLGGVEYESESASENMLHELEIGAVRPGRYQPRTEMDPQALEALAQSIRTQGVVQPIVVRPLEEPDRYEIIAGERRWRASRLAGLNTIPALVRDIPDRVAMAVALIENIQREALNPLEEAAALRRLIDECGMTHQQCAEAVGRSRAAVSNLLRLMDLNDDVQTLINRGELEMGHGRALLGIEGPQQSEIAHHVVERDLNVRQTEALVRSAARDGGSRRSQPVSRQLPELREREQALGEKLGRHEISINQNRRGRGRLVIRFRSLDDLDSLLERIH